MPDWLNILFVVLVLMMVVRPVTALRVKLAPVLLVLIFLLGTAMSHFPIPFLLLVIKVAGIVFIMVAIIIAVLIVAIVIAMLMDDMLMDDRLVDRMMPSAMGFAVLMEICLILLPIELRVRIMIGKLIEVVDLFFRHLLLGLLMKLELLVFDLLSIKWLMMLHRFLTVLDESWHI